MAVNLPLTVAQIAGGVAAGSLALIADAIHNLSDAVALGIAYVARRIARRPADDAMTFGYGRAEIVAALVNYTVLMVIGACLIYEAIWRLIEPQSVHGWIVVIVAGVALAVDTVTAILTYRLAEHSINIRAAFLHNLADAFGSIGVIVAGTLIILFNLTIVDAIITLAIAGYILWLVGSEIGTAIRILMLATPRDVSPERVLAELCRLPGIADVHHLHIWQFNEHENSLEAHHCHRRPLVAERDQTFSKIVNCQPVCDQALDPGDRDRRRELPRYRRRWPCLATVWSIRSHK